MLDQSNGLVRITCIELRINKVLFLDSNMTFQTVA